MNDLWRTPIICSTYWWFLPPQFCFLIIFSFSWQNWGSSFSVKILGKFELFLWILERPLDFIWNYFAKKCASWWLRVKV